MFCKDCKWWEPYENSQVGECGSPKWLYGYSFSSDDIGKDGIMVEADEGWGCNTGPLFGTIHFEANEKTKRSSQDYPVDYILSLF